MTPVIITPPKENNSERSAAIAAAVCSALVPLIVGLLAAFDIFEAILSVFALEQAVDKFSQLIITSAAHNSPTPSIPAVS